MASEEREWYAAEAAAETEAQHRQQLSALQAELDVAKQQANTAAGSLSQELQGQAEELGNLREANQQLQVGGESTAGCLLCSCPCMGWQAKVLGVLTACDASAEELHDGYCFLPAWLRD